MTAPVAPNESWSHRLLRPAVILPAAAVLLVAVVLLAPRTQDPRGGNDRLTTESTQPLGARLFYDLASRFGWKTERWTGEEIPVADSSTVLAELAGPDPLSEKDSHALLEHVRNGGALFYVLNGSPIEDSLHLDTGDGGPLSPVVLPAGDTDRCSSGNDGAVMLWPGSKPYMFSVRFTKGARPADLQVFATRTAGDSVGPAAVGFPYGRGRIVVVADPDLLRNDVLRVCHWRADVVAMRALDYAAGGGPTPRRRIVFDEYHQGYGLHPGTVSAVLTFLGRTTPGRVLGEILFGCIVLVFAVGARTVPPREDAPVERRSPLEHVDALGRAYDQAGAGRTITQRLVRGVRRRAERSAVPARRSMNDHDFLAWVASRHPATAPDVATVTRALDAPVTRQELEHAGEALERIEATLSTPSR